MKNKTQNTTRTMTKEDFNARGRVRYWLQSNYGKADRCESEDCTKKNPKAFNWSLIKGKSLEKNRDNFIMLCRSCHTKYNLSDKEKKRLRDNSWKREASTGGYNNIHMWLRNKFGSANKCTNSNCEGKSEIYEYALIAGKEYEYNRDNFQMLCRSCHRTYDLENDTHKTQKREEVQGE